MPDGGAREAFVAADYNAEMIAQIERYPRVRDRAIFVGDPDDIVPGTFGPGRPAIREWTGEHYAFSGYITGYDPAGWDRQALRAELGYRPDEPVCVVTVGGSGVGTHLLRRVPDAYPAAARSWPPPHARSSTSRCGTIFEQNIHVAHRLARYRAGVRLDYDRADPDHLADLMDTHIGRTPAYRPVATDGAARAAALLAGLL